MSEEMIEPCPFCGSADVEMLASNGVPHGQRGAGGTRHVECNACYATGPAEPPPRDGRAWNTRAYNPNERLREDDTVLVAIPNPKKVSGFSNDGTPMYEVKRSQIFTRSSPLPQGED